MGLYTLVRAHARWVCTHWSQLMPDGFVHINLMPSWFEHMITSLARWVCAHQSHLMPGGFVHIGHISVQVGLYTLVTSQFRWALHISVSSHAGWVVRISVSSHAGWVVHISASSHAGWVVRISVSAQARWVLQISACMLNFLYCMFLYVRFCCFSLHGYVNCTAFVLILFLLLLQNQHSTAWLPVCECMCVVC